MKNDVSSNWAWFAWIIAVLAVSSLIGLGAGLAIWRWTRSRGVTVTAVIGLWIGLSGIGLTALQILQV
ncbi:hypothetical protein QFZ56_002640 [Streptomyces achromogenes]|uniref:Uncharacterized protein n=1 Tax=Streptomyces achromogenes TaxID=67255 RepID=A0ABU0PZ58_STRAH|nr:hypothetical protein [Streptomyces achromogenes]MDQ0683677.1 hypothetical protein [Streptomyces achromogenes]